MKRLIFIVTLSFLLFFSGCSEVFYGNYHSVTPHTEDSIKPAQQTVSVSSYTQLHTALTNLVETGTSKGVFYITAMRESINVMMANAVRDITSYNPIGAYAVESISYEVGTYAGTPSVAVEIQYRHSRSEILRIKKANSIETTYFLVSAAMNQCEADLVFMVNEYTRTDFKQMVQDYFDHNPSTCMEMPQVAVSVYPDTGDRRIVEMKFTYQTSRETLRDMQDNVAQIFSSAKLYVNEDSSSWEKYSQLYSFLMERFDYKFETSITPTYSLLRHGVGDSKAFASVYAAMCQQVGLDCSMVVGTREGEPWFWNALLVDGVYYYVDLVSTYESGRFSAKSAGEMSGYVWDYSAFEVSS